MNIEYVAALLVLFGLILLILARRTRREAGLPEGRLISQDTLGARRAGETLYDPVHDLTGRPDYLVEQGDRLIPVEVKSGQAHAGPRRSHRLQLAAYCRLVESVYARRPPHGILRYADRSYAVDYTRTLEAELAATLEAMRADPGRAQERSHESPERCRACNFRAVCDQALA